jgi:excisionase family DNA binding protein
MNTMNALAGLKRMVILLALMTMPAGPKADYPVGLTRLLTLPEVMKLSNLGRSSIYKAIAAGDLRVIKHGRSLRFRSDDYERWIDSMSGGQAA